MKKEKEVTLISKEFSYAQEVNLGVFLQDITDAIAQQSEDDLDTANISFYTVEDYGENRICLDISITRLETDEEEKARELKEYREKLRIENQEKETLRRLTLKYGNK